MDQVSSGEKDRDFFFESSLWEIKWTDFLLEKVPELTEWKAGTLLGIAGSASINPNIFLSLIRTDRRYIDGDTDEQFQSKIKQLAVRLTNNYYDWLARPYNLPVDTSELGNEVTYTLWKELDKDQNKLNVIIKQYNNLKMELENDIYSISHANPTRDLGGSKRDSRSENGLIFPSPEEECWQIGR